MNPSTYDFRQFQEELAALDGKNNPVRKERPMHKKEPTHARILQAKAEFMALRSRYGLTVAEVVSFFPEEDGVAYLQGLIAKMESKPKRRLRSSTE